MKRLIRSVKSRPDRLPLPVLILIGFAIRLYHIDAQSLWYDETVSAFLAGQSPAQLIAHTARDIHPPAYYLLLHIWLMAAGRTEFTLAFFSLIFGLLLISLAYGLARMLAPQPVALWAAMLVAISPYNVWYSQEVRMYTFGAALGLAMLSCTLKALKHSPHSARYWSGYTITATLGLYTLYYFVFLLLALNLFLLIYLLRQKMTANRRPLTAEKVLTTPDTDIIRGLSQARDGSLLKALVIANALVVIGYLPWLPVAWQQATDPPVPPWRTFPEIWTVIIESWTALSLGQSIEPVSVWPILLLILALQGLGVYYLYRPTSPGLFSPALLLLTYTFGPLLLIYLLSWVTPLYHVRYLFTYSPAFYILLAAGLVYLRVHTRMWLAIGAAALLIAASFYSIYQLHFNPRYHTDDYRAAVRFIQTQWQPGDVILVNAGYVYTAFLYYANSPLNLQRQRLVPYHPPQAINLPLLLQAGTVNGNPRLGWGDPQADFYAMPAADTIMALEQISQQFSRLWLLRAYDTVTDPTGLIRQWLTENTTPLEDQPFSGESNIRAQGFLLAGAPLPPSGSQRLLFNDGMALVGWHLPNQTWQAGQTIPIKLWWTTTAHPSVDYKMSLKMWNSAGELAAQGQDQWPVGTLYRAGRWPAGRPVYQPTELKLPPDLSPGQYWLNVELYHPETIQPLRRRDNAETTVTLGPITIEMPDK